MLRDLSVNLIASALFFLLFCWLLRPRLRIASVIVERLDPEDNQVHYAFRIHNYSWFLVRDVRIALVRVTPARAQEFATKELAHGEVAFIKGYRPTVLNLQRENVCSFSRALDLKALWTPEHRLELHVVATHSLSGMSGFALAKYSFPWEQSVRKEVIHTP